MPKRTLHRSSLALCALWLASALANGASAQEATAADEDEDEDEDEGEYTDEGTMELGGSLSTAWTREDFNIALSPSFGYFVRDRIELSLIGRLEYENEEEDGGRVRTRSASLVFEPSYHHPFLPDRLYAFGGLGVGVGYDGDHPELDIVPRVGLNITVAESGIITPAFRVPIQIGKSYGSGDGVGVLPGFSFELGITTTL